MRTTVHLHPWRGTDDPDHAEEHFDDAIPEPQAIGDLIISRRSDNAIVRVYARGWWAHVTVEYDD